jgi:acetylornithine/N-succinyldiaminopimelate aminotransferase
MTTAYDTLKAREQAAICQSYGRYPLAVARARGSRLYDPDGREYVDLLAGIAVTSLGHSNPELLAVITEEAGRLIHVSNLFTQEPQIRLAEALLATFGPSRAFFCNSGAEANEAAFKLARKAQRSVFGREAYTILTLEGSFHGRTLATVAATGQHKFKEGFEPMPAGFASVPAGDVKALERAMDQSTAAVMVEIVQGEGGVKPLPGEYLSAVEKLCRENGVLFMVDEVQTGLCRTGRFWAHQRYGLSPDVMTTAKALANGLPMGAMLAKENVAAAFTPGTHASTFGGGGLVSAVAAKVVEIMRRDRLDERAERLGQWAKGLFRDIGARLPGSIEEVRGFGLMLGIVLTSPGKEVWQALFDRGFICNLTQDRVLRLLPALTIDEADLSAFAAALEDILRRKAKG